MRGSKRQKWWIISLHVTDDAIAKLYTLQVGDEINRIEGNGQKKVVTYRTSYSTVSNNVIG